MVRVMSGSLPSERPIHVDNERQTSSSRIAFYACKENSGIKGDTRLRELVRSILARPY